MPRLHKKRAAIAIAGAVIVLMAATAAALWTSRGSGTGRAQAVTAVDATTTAADGTAELYPGFEGGDLYFEISNPNSYAITYTGMESATVTSSDETGCPASNVQVDTDLTGLSLASPPGASGSLTIPDVVSMDAAAPDGCQGATFEVEITLTGTQSS
jgi:hypothetical protein